MAATTHSRTSWNRLYYIPEPDRQALEGRLMQIHDTWPELSVKLTAEESGYNIFARLVLHVLYR